jgi:hypothetical protein
MLNKFVFYYTAQCSFKKFVGIVEYFRWEIQCKHQNKYQFPFLCRQGSNTHFPHPNHELGIAMFMK